MNCLMKINFIQNHFSNKRGTKELISNNIIIMIASTIIMILSIKMDKWRHNTTCEIYNEIKNHKKGLTIN